MPLSEVIIPIFWVGEYHPYMFIHPVYARILLKNPNTIPYQHRQTMLIVDTLKKLYGLREPDNDCMRALTKIHERQEDTWYNHLPLLENCYETTR